MLREKTIVGHFWADHDAYMTTVLPEINGCIPNIARVSDYGSSPVGGGTSARAKQISRWA